MATIRRISLLVLFLLGVVLQLGAVPRLHPEGGRGEKVVVVPVQGTVDPGLAAFLRRVIEAEPDAAAVVLVVDTFGGRIDAAVQIRDLLLESTVPTVVYVDRRAISAGALISYAADTIVFAPGATMGAATPVELRGGEAEPVDEKYVSYMRAEMRATAEATGRRAEIAEAMVDRTLVVEGIDFGDDLLTVTTEQAVEIGLADGTAESLDDLLAALGLERAEQIRAEATWAEDLARFVTDPTVSGLLMSLGMLGIMIELYSPGFGLPGALGVCCLALFFGGHLLADLAGWEEALLIAIGFAALAAEVLWIPGFGVVGVVGIVLVVAGLALSMVGLPLGQSWELGFVGPAVQRVLLSIAGTAAALGVVVWFVPARAFPRWLVLQTSLDATAPALDGEPTGFRSNPDQAHLVGVRGVAVTDLRPSGKARIGDEVVDVVSRLDYLPRGTPVVVVEVEGVRVVVDRPAGDNV